jgi:hypothetical protein
MKLDDPMSSTLSGLNCFFKARMRMTKRHRDIKHNNIEHNDTEHSNA